MSAKAYRQAHSFRFGACPPVSLSATNSFGLSARMKKVLIVLGSIFLVLILLAALGIGFLAVRGNALDKESKAYADAAIPAIITTWLDKALLDRASPEFNQAASPVQVYHMFRSWESSLGRLQTCDPAQGQSLMSVTSQSGKTISAQYTAKAKFERGEATIRLILIKHGDQWQILRFDVDNLKLVPPNTQAAFRRRGLLIG